MATRAPPVGLDHLTVVPENFRRPADGEDESEPEIETETDASDR